MLRLHPRSTRTYTLFPYTTLFRSDEIRLSDIVELGFGVVAHRAGDRGERPQAAGCFEEADQLAGHLVVDAEGSQLTVRILQQRALGLAVDRLEDRKSTRMNSSH